MDDRFCSLVSFASISIQQGTAANAHLRWVINGDRVPGIIEGRLAVGIADAVSTVNINDTFNPPAMVLPYGPSAPFVQVEAVNVDGDSYAMNALIYLFNARVRETTPMGYVLWARGSGAS